jgi:hypothetical protein
MKMVAITARLQRPIATGAESGCVLHGYQRSPTASLRRGGLAHPLVAAGMDPGEAGGTNPLGR